MKKTIIALLSTIGVSFGEMTDGLVAWWTFDEDGSYTSYTGFAGGVNTGLNEKNMNLTGGVDAVGNEAPCGSH
ncbi:MAG: hypothetical protein IJA81_08635 [Akkermansia sp.]|nr:hypothetical protein [Akkermansia sp.]